MLENTTIFSKNLITWYLEFGRSLPWRETKDPYRIWLSEIILQQTRVAQGLPYYLKFIEKFPTIHDLAHAREEEVLKLWQGLGYYSRARNLHHTAKYVAGSLVGIFPNSYGGLVKLKGVGDYTASAIASICFDLPHAVVDGNVYRVLSRIFGIQTPIDSSAGIKEFKALAQELLDSSRPGTFNQALMEFGARHCTPQQPNCEHCPFATSCIALKTQSIKELPIKKGKTKIKKHYFNYIVPIDPNGNTMLEQRKGKGIWQNLFQFPLIETKKVTRLELLTKERDYQQLTSHWEIESLIPFYPKQIVHKLSHKELNTQFWVAQLANTLEKGTPSREVHNFPVPILIGNFISEFSLFND
ncbi:MAG: A/G-specific adenine glycosylase [Flavobacteriaceae bacterium]|nr:A/G-specific adenine glycosylase [Flavobacteriaceae bacterium]